MDVIPARRFSKAQRKAVWNVGKTFHSQRAAWQVVQTKVDHIQCGVDFIDTDFQTRNNVATLLTVNFHRQQTIAHKRVIGAGVTRMAAGAHHRADVTEVTGNFRIQTTNTYGTLFHVRRAEQHIDQFLHVTTHLLRQLTGLDHILFQQITTNTADQVQTVSFTCPGEDLRHLHGSFTHAEELHKAGVKTGKVTGQAEVQQVRVQTFNFQQNGADHLRTFRHDDAHRVLDGGGIGGAVRKAANAAHAVGQEGHFVVTHAGFRQLLHAAVDIEQTVVGVDDVLAVNKQTEVTGFIRGDVQWANRHYIIFLVSQFVDELVGFSIGSRRGALAIIHAVFTQRVEFVRPVIRQYQTTLIGQTNRDQTVHIAHFALAPDRSRHARRDGRELQLIGIDLNAHGNPALGSLLHRQHVVHGIMTAQLTFVVTKQHGQPAALFVVQELHHFRQVVHLDGNRQLIFGLPGFIQHDAREGLVQRREILLT